MKNQEIMSCPFCKSLDVEVDHIEFEGIKEYYIMCNDCVLTGPDAISKRIAIKSWNELPR